MVIRHHFAFGRPSLLVDGGLTHRICANAQLSFVNTKPQLLTSSLRSRESATYINGLICFGRFHFACAVFVDCDWAVFDINAGFCAVSADLMELVLAAVVH